MEFVFLTTHTVKAPRKSFSTPVSKNDILPYICIKATYSAFRASMDATQIRARWSKDSIPEYTDLE